ncbi:hypothetical protein GC176_19240 [bacterium]|nr:hypothetical protein [bacterium]
MARTQRNANPVTLFPFLAVLMCTIGALVLLLVVISAQIRGSAVQQFVASQQKNAPLEVTTPQPIAVGQPSAPERVAVESVIVVAEPAPAELPESPAARIPPPVPASVEQLARIDDLKSRAATLQADYQRAVEEFDGLTQKRDALDRQLRMIAAEEAGLKATLQQAAAVSTATGRQVAELNLENRQIIELLDQSDELIKTERKRVATPRHSLIPYDGQTGTIRKPIVIECADGTIRFQAEDVKLDVKRLEEYPPGVNPLVAGIQTLLAYWTERARAEGKSGVAARPYALLIVRPSGADQFRLARMLLLPLVGEYGYEFVEESFAYEVPATTDEAAQKCREAVAAAFQMRPRGPGVGPADFPAGSGSSGPGDRPGGVVLPRGPIDVERLTQQPAASRGFFSSGNFRRRLTGEPSGHSALGFVDGNRQAGAGDQFGRGSDQATETGQPGAGVSPRSTTTGGNISNGESRDVDQRTPVSRVAAAGERSGEPSNSNSETANSESDHRSAATPGDRSARAASGRLDAAAAGSGGSASSSGGSAVSQQRSPGQNRGQSTLAPAPRDDTPNTQLATQSAVADFLAAAKAIRERQMAASATSAGSSGTGTSNGEASVGNAAPTGGSVSSGPSSGNATTDGSEAVPDGSTSEETGNAGQTADGSTKARTTSDGTPVSGSANSPSSGEVAASGPSSPSISRSLKHDERNIAAGKRWGQSNPNASLGLERPVTFVIGKSRVLIVDAYQITLRKEWSELQAVNLCLKGLDMTANDWGKPGDRFYWVPVVTLRVENGGESLGRLLEASLERLGVMVEHEPALLESGRGD